MRVEWSRRALDQVREIFDYIVRDRPNVAAEIVDGLFDATGQLAGTPEMGAVWGRGPQTDLRIILFKTYRIIYRVDPERVVIVSVRHTRRDADEKVE